MIDDGSEVSFTWHVTNFTLGVQEHVLPINDELIDISDVCIVVSFLRKEVLQWSSNLDGLVMHEMSTRACVFNKSFSSSLDDGVESIGGCLTTVNLKLEG